MSRHSAGSNPAGRTTTLGQAPDASLPFRMARPLSRHPAIGLTHDLRYLDSHLSVRLSTTRLHVAPDHQTMSDPGQAYEFLPTKDGLVCYVRHVPSSWIVRLMPWRDPDQPRFWCLRVELATGSTLAALTANIDPFYLRLAMSRQELLDTLVRLQADAETWFGDPAQDDFRAWLADAVQLPKPPPSARTWSSLRPRPDRPPTR